MFQMIQWNLDNPTLNWSHNHMSDYRGFHSVIYKISDVSECDQIIDDVKELDYGGSM